MKKGLREEISELGFRVPQKSQSNESGDDWSRESNAYDVSTKMGIEIWKNTGMQCHTSLSNISKDTAYIRELTQIVHHCCTLKIFC